MKPSFLSIILLLLTLAMPCYAKEPKKEKEKEKKPGLVQRLKGKSKQQKQFEASLKPSDSYVDGWITNEITLESLTKAFVFLPSKKSEGVSNSKGYFLLKANTSDAQIKALHPDVFDNYYNITIDKELYTPVGAVRLKPIMVGELMQGNRSYRKESNNLVSAVNPYASIDILKYSGTPNLNQLFRNDASVEILDHGDSFGYADVRIRGFSPNLTQVNFNGININDSETGQMSSHLFSGIGNWASKVSLTKGSYTTPLSYALPAGSINIDAFMPRQKAGADAQFTYGNGNYLQSAVGLHTGATKGRKLSASLKIDRTASDGINDYTAFETMGAYLTLFAQSFQRQQFNLTSSFRSWDKQLNLTPIYNTQADELGYTFNNGWNPSEKNPYTNWNTSSGYSSLSSLNHELFIDKNQKITSSIYFQLEQNTYSDTLPDYALLQENSDSWRAGFQSRYSYQLNKTAVWWLASNLEYFNKEKQGSSNHLLAYTPFYTPADTFLFQQQANIYQVGLTTHIQQSTKQWLFLAEMAGGLKNMTQTSLDNHVKQSANTWYYRMLGGIHFKFAKLNQLKLELSASSTPQEYATIFPSYNSWKNEEVKNRAMQGAELAYEFNTGKFSTELRAFYYTLSNLSAIQNYNLNAPNEIAIINNIAQKHQGVEWNSELLYKQKHRLKVSASYNNFVYSSNPLVNVYQDQFVLKKTDRLSLTDQPIANSSPFRIYIENSLLLFREFEFCINYNHTFGTYSPSLWGNNSAPQTLLDGYGLLGANLNYYHDLRREGSRLQVFLVMNNILNTTYSNQVWKGENYPYTNQENYPLLEELYQTRSNNTWAQFGLGRNWNVGMRYIF